MLVDGYGALASGYDINETNHEDEKHWSFRGSAMVRGIIFQSS
jgi:hypothetical protein